MIWKGSGVTESRLKSDEIPLKRLDKGLKERYYFVRHYFAKREFNEINI